MSALAENAVGNEGSEVGEASSADTATRQEKSDELKKQGNTAFQECKYGKAEALYTQAIEYNSESHVLYGNRSAARHALERYEDSLTDAMRALELSPNWTKGYHRKATALISLGKLQEGVVAYEEALKLDPGNRALKRNLTKVQKRARDQQRRSRIRGLSHWLSIFSAQQDIRLRLGVMASFWNTSTKDERLAIFHRFLHILTASTKQSSRSADAQLEALQKTFTADSMTDLPLDNYSDLEIPEHWTLYFKALNADNKVNYFESMFKSLSEQEKTLVINDLKYFYSAPV